MGYILKLFDTELLKFNIVENLADPVLEIIWIDEEKKELLPLGMDISEDGLSKWIKQRTIPKNRAFVNSFLSKCGLSANRPMDVVSVCKGLSLNDSYWVVEDTDATSFGKANLYRNNFSRILANVAFTGYGSSVRSTFASSPEFTTNGMLPKCWRRIDSKVYLYKGGTSGASNTGCEPYSEKYAYLIGKKLQVNVVPYSIKMWKNELCSVCEIFTSEELSFVPIGRIVKKGGMKAVREYYEVLGAEFVKALDEMIVFDAIICNTDRHFGNFGVLVDSRTNRIVKPAPLFDHGNSLFNFAGKEGWASEDALSEYAETLLPRVYDDFFTEAKKVMDDDLRKKVRGMLNFRFEKPGRYNYSKAQMKLLEKQIQKRAIELLK